MLLVIHVPMKLLLYFANSAPNYGSKTKLLLITTHQE